MEGTVMEVTPPDTERTRREYVVWAYSLIKTISQRINV